MGAREAIDCLMMSISTSAVSVEPVLGGLTNETYLVSDGTHRYIARIAGTGTESIINREDEYFNMSVGTKLGISPQIYAYINGNFLMEYIPAHTIRRESELLYGRVLNNFTDALIKLHTSGEKLRNRYDIIANIHVYKNELNNIQMNYPQELIEHEGALYEATAWMLRQYEDSPVACHVDNIFGNIINLPGKAVLIDWEYSGMCDIYCDLANFSLLNDMSETTEKIFLENYFGKAKSSFIKKKYIYYKMAANYMWVYWHLIKEAQGQNVEYNSRRWKERLSLALMCKEKAEEIS